MVKPTQELLDIITDEQPIELTMTKLAMDEDSISSVVSALHTRTNPDSLTTSEMEYIEGVLVPMAQRLTDYVNALRILGL